MFFGMGFRVFRFRGHFFIAYLGCENILQPRKAMQKMMRKHENIVVYNRPKFDLIINSVQTVCDVGVGKVAP